MCFSLETTLAVNLEWERLTYRIRSCGASHLLRVGRWHLILILLATSWLLTVSASGVALSAGTVKGVSERQAGVQAPPVSLQYDVSTADSSASPWVRSPQGAVRLVSTVTGVGTGQSIRLGLQFHLQPHWKIYWRTPGDAGYPPTIDWSGSQNLSGISIAWPAPRRFSFRGIETAGYEEEVVFPITATLEKPGVPFNGRLIVEFLTCADFCVPQRAEVNLLILDGPAKLSPFMHLVERHAARVPGDGRAAGLRLIAATLKKEKKENFIDVKVASTFPFRTPDLFIEGHGDDTIHAGTPQITQQSQDGRQIVLRASTRSPVAVGTLATLTVVDGLRALEATIPLSSVVKVHDETTKSDVAIILGLAFLGGFILNLMPCVLPVLSIKVITLVGHGGTEKRAVRWRFLASAAGVLFSFLLIALATITLQAAGAAVGWGMQFQQPLFLSVLIIVLALFTANLWGVFEIVLPSWLTDRIGGVCTYGYIGDFLTGIFSTLLATPCSAPFLGTAVGFALARGPSEILMIFTMLGLGMAMPYVLVALFPILAARLPRPGPWMIHLRKFAGIILFITIIWLSSILWIQTDQKIIILILLTILFLFLLKKKKITKILLISLFLAFIMHFSFLRKERHTPWLPFDETALAHHVADGRVVFVDVTADWCITCQINKALVLSHREVVKRLHNVVAMQADWTRHDGRVSAYLAGFGRYGIPFNVVYGPGAPQGLLLPELLTAEGVLKALDVAAGHVSSLHYDGTALIISYIMRRRSLLHVPSPHVCLEPI